jgi:hypothetical protein
MGALLKVTTSTVDEPIKLIANQLVMPLNLGGIFPIPVRLEKFVPAG